LLFAHHTLQLVVYSGIMHVMAREAWTDERLDDLTKRMDERFGEVDRRFGEVNQRIDEVVVEQKALRTGLKSLQGEIGTVREGQGELRAELKGLNRTLQIGFGLIGSFLGVLTILIGAQL
jgi:septal ring factor EnvC (AmiA/AmiB activator)